MILAIDWEVWDSNPSLGKILTGAEANSAHYTMNTVCFRGLVLHTQSILEPKLHTFWSYARPLCIYVGMSYGDVYFQTVPEYKAVLFIEAGCFSETKFRIIHSTFMKIILMTIVFSEFISFSKDAQRQTIPKSLSSASVQKIHRECSIALHSKIISIELRQVGY